MADPALAGGVTSNTPAPTPVSGITPVTNTSYNAQGNYTNSQNGSGMSNAYSQFTPQQLALQSQLPGMYQGYLSGSQEIPAYFTAPPQVFKAYNDAFQKYVAPGIAAQYGAGSPQIGGQQSFGNEQLAANLYQSGVQNWLAGLNGAGNLAFNPIGQQAANNYQTAGNQTSNVLGLQQTGSNGSILAYLLGLARQASL